MKNKRKILAAFLAAALFIIMVPGNSFYGFAEEEGVLLAGDANGDGVIDSKDALAILKHSMGIEQTDFIENAADTDNDGEINAKDALIILKYSVGIIKVIPAACTEHVWDEGKFIEMYFTEDAAGDSSYHTDWKLEVQSQSASGLKDVLLDCILFSNQAHDGEFEFNPDTQEDEFIISRPCEEGLKEYTCKICSKKKVDFSVKKRSVPTEENAVTWAEDASGDPFSYGGYLPTKSGWTGKKFWIEDKAYDWFNLEYIDLSEEIYSKEQEQALDAISARFVSGNLGLWEYEAAVREYLSSLNMFDTSKTKGELLIGCNIYFEDNMQSIFFAEPRPCTSWSIDKADGTWQDIKLNDHPFQYVYLNSYYDKEKLHSANYTITIYVKNPLLTN